MNEWIGYLAGMIDGEGTVSINKSPPSKNGFKRYLPWVRICINQEEPLEFLQSLFGGNLRKRQTTNDYELEWCGTKAQAVIKIVINFLRIKKQQALLLLDFPQHKTSKRHTEEERKKRDEIYLKVRELNQARTSFSFSPPQDVGVGDEKEE